MKHKPTINKSTWIKVLWLILAIASIGHTSQAQKFNNTKVLMPAKKQFKADRPFKKMLEYNKMSADSTILLINNVFRNHFESQLGASFIATHDANMKNMSWLRDSTSIRANSFKPEQFSGQPFLVLPAITDKKHTVLTKRMKEKGDDQKAAIKVELQGQQLLSINKIKLQGRFPKSGRMKVELHCELFNPELQSIEVRRLDLVLPFRRKMFFSVLEMKLREELSDTFK
jgi:hypothetical protein